MLKVGLRVWHFGMPCALQHFTGERDDVQKAPRRVKKACSRQSDSWRQPHSLYQLHHGYIQEHLRRIQVILKELLLMLAIARIRKSLQDLESQIEKATQLTAALGHTDSMPHVFKKCLRNVQSFSSRPVQFIFGPLRQGHCVNLSHFARHQWPTTAV